MARKPKAGTEQKPLVVEAREGETEAATMARVMVSPYLRHGVVASDLSKRMVGTLPGEPRFDDFSLAIKAIVAATAGGDKTLATELLTSQALSLDIMFTEFSRRASMNMGDYPLATERYARLAFKAQANCRASLEALAKLHQPREQTVRHVHVNEGGQAIVADEFHNHTGGGENDKSNDQSHSTAAIGAAGTGTALLGTDALGSGMPIASRSRETAVQDARRD